MTKKILSFVLILLVVLMLNPSMLKADDTSEAILKILIKKGIITQQEVDEMKAEVEKEKAAKKVEAPKTVEERLTVIEKDLASKVSLDKLTSKLKLKGRWAAGFYDSGKAGSFPSGSFEAPEAKIQFSFQPDDINTIVMRFNLNNATAQSPLMDYFFLQSKDFFPFLKNTPFSLSGRLGRFKLGFGEETWSNNPVESVLPSNSAGNVGLNDEGLELSGKIKLEKIHLQPLGWVFSVSDGNSGVGSDTSGAKAFMGKLYYRPIDPLYLSASYYNSGELKASNAEMSIAGLTSPPTGTTEWTRSVWEVDARYDFGKGKKPFEPIAFSDSKAILRLSYGQFNDDTSSAAKRDGQFGFVEGTYNLSKKFYTAARYSIVDLNGDQTASLNSITANRYERYSIGLGYRWSENTILKLGYDWNKESQVSTEDKPNNLLSAIVASQF